MEIVILVIVGIVVIYKLGLFTPVKDLADAAQVASSEYSDSVFNDRMRRAQEESLTTDEMTNAVANIAMTQEFKKAYLKGALATKVKAEEASS